jgi:hypothetical protein
MMFAEFFFPNIVSSLDDSKSTKENKLAGFALLYQQTKIPSKETAQVEA